jgi:hypothetical protein
MCYSVIALISEYPGLGDLPPANGNLSVGHFGGGLHVEDVSADHIISFDKVRIRSIYVWMQGPHGHGLTARRRCT